MEPDLANPSDGGPERFVPEAMHGQLVEAEHLGRYWWLAGLASGRRALDAGCGVAYGAQMLSEAGAETVVGVDIAPDVVEAARGRVGPGVRVELADLRRLPFPDDSFDLVACFEVIEHVADPGTILSELSRVLAPGGVAAVSTPNRDQSLGINPYHVGELTPKELTDLVSRHFDHVRLVRQHTWLASAVLEDDLFAAGDGEAAEGAQVRKVFGAAPGEEVYTIALAGNAELPPPPPTVVLTHAVDFAGLLDHIQQQQRVLSEQASEVREARLLERQQRELADRLEAADRVLARLTELDGGMRHAGGSAARLHELQAALDQITSSRSWRLLSPARALASRARRLARG